jgi:hypothetical protein
MTAIYDEYVKKITDILKDDNIFKLTNTYLHSKCRNYEIKRVNKNFYGSENDIYIKDDTLNLIPIQKYFYEDEYFFLPIQKESIVNMSLSYDVYKYVLDKEKNKDCKNTIIQKSSAFVFIRNLLMTLLEINVSFENLRLERKYIDQSYNNYIDFDFLIICMSTKHNIENKKNIDNIKSHVVDAIDGDTFITNIDYNLFKKIFGIKKNESNKFFKKFIAKFKNFYEENCDDIKIQLEKKCDEISNCLRKITISKHKISQLIMEYYIYIIFERNIINNKKINFENINDVANFFNEVINKFIVDNCEDKTLYPLDTIIKIDNSNSDSDIEEDYEDCARIGSNQIRNIWELTYNVYNYLFHDSKNMNRLKQNLLIHEIDNINNNLENVNRENKLLKEQINNIQVEINKLLHKTTNNSEFKFTNDFNKYENFNNINQNIFLPKQQYKYN